MAAASTRLSVIALDHVTKNFRMGERDLTILNDISPEISRGEFAAESTAIEPMHRKMLKTKITPWWFIWQI